MRVYDLLHHASHAAKSAREADPAIHLTELEDEDERIAGSTATVALIRQDKIIVANVGDSRAVLCRLGRAVDLTTEHRRVAQPSMPISVICEVLGPNCCCSSATNGTNATDAR